ncbi:hypothetical protein [Exiguobacterium alkaliphilum]|uniref:hypothetical protein n=1 Tax=Exiguobacterium alkaliphilum TaxID=1428684 RepID=UPI00403B1BC1
MENKSGYYLFRVEKVVKSKNMKSVETLYIIDFVVESDFEHFISNEEMKDVNLQDEIKKLIKKEKSSHIILRGVAERLVEDEVFQLPSRIVKVYFEINSQNKKIEEILNLYDVFYNRFIGFIDIETDNVCQENGDEKEGVIGKRRMTRKYSEEYNFVSDKKLFRRG